MNCDLHLLIEFTLGNLDLREIEEVTTHLESCRECSLQLQLIARLRANREEVQTALRQHAETERTIPSSSDAGREILPVKEKNWRYLWAAAAMLLTALGVSLFFSWPRSSEVDLALLATTVKPPYEPMVLRNGGPGRHPLFIEAMEEYTKGGLSAARDKLNRYLLIAGDDSEARFYLGGILFLEGDYAKAEDSIRRGLASCTICAKEKYYWYLAQIALKQNRREEARRFLEQVLLFRGPYAPQAEAILARIGGR